jgi:hypothetical protein
MATFTLSHLVRRALYDIAAAGTGIPHLRRRRVAQEPAGSSVTST